MNTYEVTETFAGGKRIRQEWRVNGKYHRVDGPAWIEYIPDGSIWCEQYYIEGKYHREDGPACITRNDDGSIWREAYYIEGKHLSNEVFLKRTSCSGKIVEIDGKKYRLEEV